MNPKPEISLQGIGRRYSLTQQLGLAASRFKGRVPKRGANPAFFSVQAELAADFAVLGIGRSPEIAEEPIPFP